MECSLILWHLGTTDNGVSRWMVQPSCVWLMFTIRSQIWTLSFIPGKISPSLPNNGAKMLSLHKMFWVKEANHKGNQKPTWGWNLSLPTQRGISLFKSIIERIDLEFHPRARSLRQYWIYRVCGKVGRNFIGQWSQNGRSMIIWWALG